MPMGWVGVVPVTGDYDYLPATENGEWKWRNQGEILVVVVLVDHSGVAIVQYQMTGLDQLSDHP